MFQASRTGLRLLANGRLPGSIPEANNLKSDVYLALNWKRSEGQEAQVNSEEFLERLKREVIGHPALRHPFLERFGDGEADGRCEERKASPEARFEPVELLL